MVVYINLCNQCLSPLLLWVWTPLRWCVLDTTLCDKVCQWLAAGRWCTLGFLCGLEIHVGWLHKTLFYNWNMNKKFFLLKKNPTCIHNKVSDTDSGKPLSLILGKIWKMMVSTLKWCVNIFQATYIDIYTKHWQALFLWCRVLWTAWSWHHW